MFALSSILAGVKTSFWFAQSPAADPSSFVTSFGAFAAAATVLLLWQRDTARQRDRLLDLEEKRGPMLVEVRDILRTNVEVLEKASEAMHLMGKALDKIPSDEELIRLRDALDRVEPNYERRDRSGGG